MHSTDHTKSKEQEWSGTAAANPCMHTSVIFGQNPERSTMQPTRVEEDIKAELKAVTDYIKTTQEDKE